MEDFFENIYWKDAGVNRQTGQKTLTLRQFEEKHLDSFIALAKRVRGNTLEDKALRMQDRSPELTAALRAFDRLYNVEWPLVHLQTAQHYLDSRGDAKAATGGSEWKNTCTRCTNSASFSPRCGAGRK